MRFTERTCDALRHSGKPGSPSYYWDERLPGFGIRVYESGKRSFVCSFRRHGRKRIMVLGPRSQMKVEQARREALGVLNAVREGKDPLLERQKYRQAPTVHDLMARTLAWAAEPKRNGRSRQKPRTRKTNEGFWGRHILPSMGDRKVVDITFDDVQDLIDSMSETPIAANRTLSCLSTAFGLAEKAHKGIRWRKRGSNPCRGVERYEERSREVFLTEDQIARVGDALSEAEQNQTEKPGAIHALRLLILTGCRSSEILMLKWNEVDLDEGKLRLLDSKTGQREVILSPPAIELLSTISQVPGNPYVCVGRKSGWHWVDLRKPWWRIRETAGVASNVRIHDIRHSWASMAVSSGLSLALIGKLMGHTNSRTTERYAHLYEDPLRRAAAKVGSAIESAGSSQGDLIAINRA